MKLILCCALATLMTSGCSRSAEITGIWKGSCKLAQKDRPSKIANADIEFVLGGSETALNGSVRITFTNTKSLGEPDLTLTSGVLTDGKVIFTARGASNSFGGEEFRFEGVLHGSTLAGTAEYSFPSIFSKVKLAGELNLHK